MAVFKDSFTMRLDPEMHVKIKKLAAANQRSMTNMIVFLIAKAIDEYENEHGVIPVTEEEMYGD